MFDCRFDAAAILALQSLQERQTFFHFAQRSGVGIDAFTNGGEFAGELNQFLVHEVEALLHDLTARELPGAELLSRRSTLEDVFLDLTGRGLDE